MTTVKATSKLAVKGRRERFCQEYALNGGNATQAYIAAGYSENGARQNAHILMTNHDIQERVKFYRRQFHEKLMASKVDALQNVARLAMFDPLAMFDENGRVKPLSEMDEATRKSITELKMTTINGASVDSNNPPEVYITEVKFGKDTRAYNEMLMKHFNAYEDHLDSGTNKDLKIYLMFPQDALA